MYISDLIAKLELARQESDSQKLTDAIARLKLGLKLGGNEFIDDATIDKLALALGVTLK